MTLKCARCKLTKLVSCFPRSTKAKSGFCSWCRACQTDYKRAKPEMARVLPFRRPQMQGDEFDAARGLGVALILAFAMLVVIVVVIVVWIVERWGP